MTIPELLTEARRIWGIPASSPYLHEVIVPMGVIYGDICRCSRDTLSLHELEKEMGNMILSTIRWCDELHLDLDICLKRAIECQEEFVRRHRKAGR